MLVGVGVVSGDAEASDLMTQALLAAVVDAGCTTLAPAIDRIAVPQGTWSYPDPARLVSEAIGARSARTHLVELGIPQQCLINDALSAILAGASDVAVVVGGEAKRWSRDHGRGGQMAVETTQPGAVPDEVRRRTGDLVEPVEVATGLWEPVCQYAMIDNALGRAEGRSGGDHRRDVADLWARFNQVAQTNPRASFPAPMTATMIDTPTPGNRPLAFPYNKWHSTQWTVNQSGALLLCSVEAARSFGVSTDRWLFPLVGLESSHAVSLLRRAEPHRWPAMGVLGRAASFRIGRTVADIEVTELYSCFPAAVRVQQRELGLDNGGTPTITGGMAFAGGPFNNAVLQATAEVAARIRADTGSLGMVTSVSGLLTKPGLGVWSTEPDGRPSLVADLATEVAGATPVVDVHASLDEYAGPATVVTFTITYDGMEPVRTVVLCDTADNRRCVAFADDRLLAAHAVANGLAGTDVHVTGGSFELA